MSNSVVSMGLDLSLTETGVAVIAEGEVMLLEVIKPAMKANTIVSESMRMDYIVARIGLIKNMFDPDITVIEGPSLGSRVGKIHERAGLWWRTVEEVIEVPSRLIVKVSPQSRAKFATGSGASKKPEVLAAVQARYKDMNITNHNIADAVLLADIGLYHCGSQYKKGSVNSKCQEVLSKVMT